jgi:hypothetical protein
MSAPIDIDEIDVSGDDEIAELLREANAATQAKKEAKLRELQEKKDREEGEKKATDAKRKKDEEDARGKLDEERKAKAKAKHKEKKLTLEGPPPLGVAATLSRCPDAPGGC